MCIHRLFSKGKPSSQKSSTRQSRWKLLKAVLPSRHKPRWLRSDLGADGHPGQDPTLSLLSWQIFYCTGSAPCRVGHSSCAKFWLGNPSGLPRATLGEAVWHCRIANIRGWDGAHLVSEGSFLELFVPVGPEEIWHLDSICRCIIGIAILQMLIKKEGVACIMIYTLLFFDTINVRIFKDLMSRILA